MSEEQLNAALVELAKNAGSALPILKKPDPELKKMPVVIDFEEMRQRNAATAKRLRS